MKTILTPSTLIAFAPADTKSGGSAETKPAEAKDGKAKDPKPKAPKRGVGVVAMEAILRGATNSEALDAVRKEFPDGNTSKASVNWYRNKARKDGAICTSGPWAGKLVPSAREMAKAAKSAAEGKDAKDATASGSKPTAADDPTA